MGRSGVQSIVGRFVEEVDLSTSCQNARSTIVVRATNCASSNTQIFFRTDKETLILDSSKFWAVTLN